MKETAIWQVGRVAHVWLKVGVDLTGKIDRKYAETLKDGLFKASLEAVGALKLANKLRVVSKETRLYQVRQQNMALAKMGMAEEIVLLAHDLEQITSEQLANWQKHHQNLERMTRGWIKYCNDQNAIYI